MRGLMWQSTRSLDQVLFQSYITHSTVKDYFKKYFPVLLILLLWAQYCGKWWIYCLDHLVTNVT